MEVAINPGIVTKPLKFYVLYKSLKAVCIGAPFQTPLTEVFWLVGGSHNALRIETTHPEKIPRCYHEVLLMIPKVRQITIWGWYSLGYDVCVVLYIFLVECVRNLWLHKLKGTEGQPNKLSK